MSNFQKLTPAQKIRQNYKLMLLNSPKAKDPAPRMHEDNPLLPPTPADSNNQLPARYRGVPLKVLLDGFAESGSPKEDVSIQLKWGGTKVGNPITTVTPIDPGAFPLLLELPGEYTEVQGRYELSAEIDFGGNPEDTELLIIDIDTTPPNPNGTIVLPPAVESDGITKEYLADNGGFVRVAVDRYGGMKIGDVIEAYYGDALPTAKKFGTFERVDPVIPVEFQLTAEVIGSLEGKHTIFYYVTDRVGNRSLHSDFKYVEVILTDPLLNLLAPDIPLAADDIDFADAYEGVGVGIVAPYTNYLPGDQLVVTWDGVLQSPQTIPVFPFYVTLPYRVIKNGNEGPKVATVSYQILRGGKYYPVPPTPAPFVDVNVDLRKPGPEDPDPENPDPINPKLLPVVVRGGGANAEDDKLNLDDATFPATAKRLIYENFKVDDVVQLYWKGVAVPEDSSARGQGGVWKVEAGDTDATVMEFTVPWAIIEAGGNLKELPVYYTVAHAMNGNVATSVSKNVEVLIRDGAVPAPVFLNLHPTLNRLVCSSIRLDALRAPVIEVAVPGGEPQLADQELTFTYQGYSEETGTSPIPGNTHDVKYTPTTQEASAGFIVRIPYEPFRVTKSAWGAISYEAIIDGFETPSSRHLVRVHMVLGSGDTCAIPTS